MVEPSAGDRLVGDPGSKSLAPDALRIGTYAV